MGDEPDGDDDGQEKVKFSITLPKAGADRLLENSPASLDYQDAVKRAIETQLEIDDAVAVTIERDRKE